MDIELEAAVARPAREVFAYLASVDRWPEWRGALRSAVREGSDGAQPIATGARWRLGLHAMGRDVEMLVEVTVVEPPSRLDVLTVEGPFRGTSRFDIVPLDDGSMVRIAASVELTGGLKLVESLLEPHLRQAWLDDLRALTDRLESI